MKQLMKRLVTFCGVTILALLLMGSGGCSGERDGAQYVRIYILQIGSQRTELARTSVPIKRFDDGNEFRCKPADGYLGSLKKEATEFQGKFIAAQTYTESINWGGNHVPNPIDASVKGNINSFVVNTEKDSTVCGSKNDVITFSFGIRNTNNAGYKLRVTEGNKGVDSILISTPPGSDGSDTLSYDFPTAGVFQTVKQFFLGKSDHIALPPLPNFVEGDDYRNTPADDYISIKSGNQSVVSLTLHPNNANEQETWNELRAIMESLLVIEAQHNRYGSNFQATLFSRIDNETLVMGSFSGSGGAMHASGTFLLVYGTAKAEQSPIDLQGSYRQFNVKTAFADIYLVSK